MIENEKIKTLYIYEQNILKSCTEKIINSSSEECHDCFLLIFDQVDEIMRKIYKSIHNDSKRSTITKKKKEELYEEFDSKYISI